MEPKHKISDSISHSVQWYRQPNDTPLIEVNEAAPTTPTYTSEKPPPHKGNALIISEDDLPLNETINEPLMTASALTANHTIVDPRQHHNIIRKPFMKRPLISKLKGANKKGSPLVRVIQMSPPTIVTTKPENFRSVVQKLTGSPSSCSLPASPPSSPYCMPSLPEHNIVPETTAAPMSTIIANYLAASPLNNNPFQSLMLPNHLQTANSPPEGYGVDDEVDNVEPLYITCHGNKESILDQDRNKGTVYDSFEGLLSSSRGDYSEAMNGAHLHEIRGAAAEYHDRTTSSDAAPSTSSTSTRFSMGTCFDELADGFIGADDTFEAQSSASCSRSNSWGREDARGATGLSSTAQLYDEESLYKWDLGAMEDFFDAMEGMDHERPMQQRTNVWTSAAAGSNNYYIDLQGINWADDHIMQEAAGSQNNWDRHCGRLVSS